MTGFFDHAYHVDGVLLSPERRQWINDNGKVLCECVEPVFEPFSEGVKAGAVSARIDMHQRVEGELRLVRRTARGWERVRGLLGPSTGDACVESIVISVDSRKEEEPPLVYCTFSDEAALVVRRRKMMFSASMIVAVRHGMLSSEIRDSQRLMRDRIPAAAWLSAEIPWGQPSELLTGYYVNVIRDMSLQGVFQDDASRHSAPISQSRLMSYWKCETVE